MKVKLPRALSAHLASICYDTLRSAWILVRVGAASGRSERKDSSAEPLRPSPRLMGLVEWVVTYVAAGSLLMAALAGHLEGDIVGSVALDLDSTGRH